MSGILNRRVFYAEVDGKRRYQDWAVVATTVGNCAEPFTVNDRPSGETYEPDDMMRRIDSEQRIDISQKTLVLSDEKTDLRLHGGDQSIRA
jgi:hypothetical protein